MDFCEHKGNNTLFTPNLTAWKTLSSDELVLFKILLEQMSKDSREHPDWPCIKPHFRNLWILFAVLYSTVGICGLVGNVYMSAAMIIESSFQRCINYLLLNLFVSDMLKCLMLIPLTLSTLLLKNWWFGPTLCNLFPMVQHFPLLLSVMTYSTVAVDRYMTVFHSSRIPQGHKFYVIVIVAIWVICACLVSPFRSYMTYIDLEVYLGSVMKGQALCVVGFSSAIREYNSWLFVAMYAVPVVLTGYMFARIYNELKTRRQNEENSRLYNTKTYDASYIAANAASDYQTELEQTRQFLSPVPRINRPISASRNGSISTSCTDGVFQSTPITTGHRRSVSLLDCIDKGNGQVALFMKANQCLTIMVILFTVCWLPLQALMLLSYVIPERTEATGLVDFLFLTFLLVGFLSTVANPCLLLYQRRVIQEAVSNGLRMVRNLSLPPSISRSRRSSRHQDEHGNDTTAAQAPRKFSKSLEHLELLSAARKDAKKDDKCWAERHSN